MSGFRDDWKSWNYPAFWESAIRTLMDAMANVEGWEQVWRQNPAQGFHGRVYDLKAWLAGAIEDIEMGEEVHCYFCGDILHRGPCPDSSIVCKDATERNQSDQGNSGI